MAPWPKPVVGPMTALPSPKIGAAELGSYSSIIRSSSTLASSMTSNITDATFRHRILAMRLRIREGELLPFQDLFTSFAGDKVFIFIVKKNEAITLEDDASMYPSDALVTQLRLLAD